MAVSSEAYEERTLVSRRPADNRRRDLANLSAQGGAVSASRRVNHLIESIDWCRLSCVPRPETVDRLLDTAERLFGEQGVDAVSLRAINAEAEMNPAAVHYHFGSREALVEAVLERRMSAVMARRAARLDALEAGHETPSARAIAEAVVLPLAELAAETGAAGRRYVLFLERLSGASAPELARFVERRFGAGTKRLEALVLRTFPALPRPVARLRLAMGAELMIRGLANGARVAAIVDFIAGGLAAPHTEDPS
jgi:AcrR family transcriptional regulator